MLAWITNYLHRKAREKSRAIFRYWDGQQYRSADPHLIWEALETDPEFEAKRHAEGIDRGDLESIAIGVRAVQRAFKVKPFAEGGLTCDESIVLLIEFWEYLDRLKKNINQLPTSSPPMGSESSQPVNSPTNAESDSGKTPNDPN